MADKNQSTTSHLMRLPTEVREQILRHLLISKYTAREHTTDSATYDGWRSYILEGPDQYHYFYPEIMSVCRRLYEESVDLCRRENDFVCLTSCHSSVLGSFLASQGPLHRKGLHTIAECSETRWFWNIAMTITLEWDDPEDDYWRHHHDRVDEPPCKFIICSDQLPRFCRLLMSEYQSLGWTRTPLIGAAIYIDVDSGLWNGHTKEMDRCPAGLSKLSRLLEPLWQLHSFGAAQIEGPLSSSLKSDLNSSLCRVCPTAIEDFMSATASLIQGDEQDYQGNHDDALRIYKEALNLVRSCSWSYDEQDFILEGGPFPELTFPELTTEQAMFNLKIRLITRIAAMYLKAGQLRMARIYTDRAVVPKRGLTQRSWKTYELSLADWQKPIFAEVLHVSAEISCVQRAFHTAVDDLREADTFVPLNEEQRSKLEGWTIFVDERRERRWDRLAKQLELENRKARKHIEETFPVVCNWKNKGDLLVQTGRTILAASPYRGALSRIEDLYERYQLFRLEHGPFEGCELGDVALNLWFKTQASLAASQLRSRSYRDILECTDAAFAWYERVTLSPSWCKQSYAYRWEDGPVHLCGDGCNTYLPLHSLSVTQQIEGARINYCRAMAHKHLGHLADAVDYMEEALKFDPGDEQAFKQLGLLKQKQEKVNAHRIRQLLEQRVQRAKRKELRERLARGRLAHAGDDRYLGDSNRWFHLKFWAIEDSDSDSSSEWGILR